LMPGRGVNMGDGWETRRLRTPGNDWAVIALGHAGTIERIVVDTAHFRGNYPAAFSLNAAYVPTLHDSACVAASMFWQPLFAKTELSANAEHEFDSGVLISEPVTHVRLNIYPDGGVSRLRLLGRAS
ncbi:MAG: allantoicase, partial [Proteobacteria bacterium]|nr:allantoicase [Pseudomonadota bacterium]